MSYHHGRGLGLTFALDLSQSTLPLPTGGKVTPLVSPVPVPAAVQQSLTAVGNLRDQLSSAMASGNFSQLSLLKPGLALLEGTLATRLSQWVTSAKSAYSQTTTSLRNAQATGNATVISAATSANAAAKRAVDLAEKMKADAVVAKADTLNLIVKAEAMAKAATLETRLTTARALLVAAEAALVKALASGDATRSRFAQATFNLAKQRVATLEAELSRAQAIINAEKLAQEREQALLAERFRLQNIENQRILAEQAAKDEASRLAAAALAERARLAMIANQAAMAEQAAKDEASRRAAAAAAAEAAAAAAEADRVARAAQAERDRLAQADSFSYEPDPSATQDAYDNIRQHAHETEVVPGGDEPQCPPGSYYYPGYGCRSFMIDDGGECPPGSSGSFPNCVSPPVERPSQGTLLPTKIPWLWIGLGTAGVATVGYLIYRSSK